MTSQHFHFSPGVPRLVAQEVGRVWGGQTEHGWWEAEAVRAGTEIESRVVCTGGTELE